MDTQSFDGIALNRPPRGVGRPFEKGRVEAGEGFIEFRSKRGTVRMDPVRDISVSGAQVMVTYGASGGSTASLSDFRRGALGVGDQAPTLANDLRRAVGLAAPSAAEEAARKQQRAVEAVPAGRAEMSRARVQMWISGAVFLVGVIVTLVTLSAASEGGGTYYVLWGAMLFGALGFLQGVAAYREGRRKASGTWVPKTATARQQKTILIVVLSILAAILIFTIAVAIFYEG